MDVESLPDKVTQPCEKFEPQFWRKSRCKTCFFTEREHPPFSDSNSNRMMSAPRLALSAPLVSPRPQSRPMRAKPILYDSEPSSFGSRQSPAFLKLASEGSPALSDESHTSFPSLIDTKSDELPLMLLDTPPAMSCLSPEANTAPTPITDGSPLVSPRNMTEAIILGAHSSEIPIEIAEPIENMQDKIVPPADEPDHAPSDNLIYIAPVDSSSTLGSRASSPVITEVKPISESSVSPLPAGLPVPNAALTYLETEAVMDMSTSKQEAQSEPRTSIDRSSENGLASIKESAGDSSASPSPPGRRRHEKQFSLSSGMENKMLGQEPAGKRNKIKTSASTGNSSHRHSIALESIRMPEASHTGPIGSLEVPPNLSPPKRSVSPSHTGDYSSVSSVGPPSSPQKQTPSASTTPLRSTKSHFFGIRSSTKKDKEHKDKEHKDKEKDKEAKDKDKKQKHKKSKTNASASTTPHSSGKYVPITAYTMEQILHSTNVAKPDTEMKEAMTIRPFVSIAPFDPSILNNPPTSYPPNYTQSNGPTPIGVLHHHSTAPGGLVASSSTAYSHSLSSSQSSSYSMGTSAPPSSKKEKKKKDKEHKDKDKDHKDHKDKDHKDHKEEKESHKSKASSVDFQSNIVSGPPRSTSPIHPAASETRLRSNSEATRVNADKMGPRGKSKSKLKHSRIASQSHGD